MMIKNYKNLTEEQYNKLNKFIYISNAHKNMLNSLNQILNNL